MSGFNKFLFCLSALILSPQEGVAKSLFLPATEKTPLVHLNKVRGVQFRPARLWIGEKRYTLKKCRLFRGKDKRYHLKSLSFADRNDIKDEDQNNFYLTFSIGQELTKKQIFLLQKRCCIQK